MRKPAIVMTSALMLALVAPTLQFAVAQEEPNRPVRSQDVTAESRAASRASRVNANKERVSDPLTAQREQRYIARCNDAQTQIATLQASTERVMNNRLATYNRIDELLSNLELQLEEAGLDTTSFNEVRSTLSSPIEQAKVDLEAYSLTLSDLSVLDCVEDPEAFHATLLAARELRAKLISNTGAVTSRIREEMLPLLQTIREDLSTQASNQGDNSGEAE